MKTKNKTEIFLILVPHRDIRGILRKYSNELFNAGFYGAYSFPHVAPIASLTKPLLDDELKHTASSIREMLGDCKFNSIKTASLKISESLKLFGTCLQYEEFLTEALNQRFTRHREISFFQEIVIGSCILDGNENGELPPPPQVSFRAAAVANMFWQADTEKNIYKWKIGKLHWLAKTIC